ncbi:hypothetical protein GYA19_00225, partial [Candidatus Beckwithbacteria bacterium]|nr:hypothetical protein [Candidatus Beckwithbacteria bacterium]
MFIKLPKLFYHKSRLITSNKIIWKLVYGLGIGQKPFLFRQKAIESIENIYFAIKNYFFTPSKSRAYFQLIALCFGSCTFVIGVYLGLSNYIIPRIYALNETSLTMPTDVAFNRGETNGLAAYDDDSGTVTVLSDEIRIA